MFHICNKLSNVHQVLVNSGRYLTKHPISHFKQSNPGSNKLDMQQIWTVQIDINLDMIVIDEKFLAIKEIN
jgi:hypothetical protein